MATHVKVVGILHIVMGAFGVMAGLAAFFIFGGIATAVGLSDDEGALVAVPILGVIGVIALVILLVLSIPGIIVGFGLVNFRPWARILGIVLSAIHLFNVPFGTALGVYGLWALLGSGTEQLFDRRRLQPITDSASRF